MSHPLHPSQLSTPIPYPPPLWLDRGRIPCLDGLRALAILLVIYAHGRFPGDHFLPIPMLKGRCGFLGVQIFFVLSGFLITTLMLREIQRNGRVHLGQFYLRRALRIVPVYAAYLLVLAVLDACGTLHLQNRHWLAAATYTVNFLPRPLPMAISHLWSLCVEEHFYLLWPLFLALLPPRWCFRAIPACLVLAFAARWALLAFSQAAVDLLTFTRIDDIAVGCGLAYLARSPAARHWLHWLTSSRRLVLFFLLFAASQVCLSRKIGPSLLSPAALPLGLALSNDVNVLTIAVLMWTVLTRTHSFCGRLLNHPAAVRLGVLSYSIYLWHALFLMREEPAWIFSFPQDLLFIFVAATMSYRWIELPFLRWKDRLFGESPLPLVGQARSRMTRGPRRPMREKTLWRVSGASSKRRP